MMTCFCTTLVLFANLLVGTWNLRWFPTGAAEPNPLMSAAEQQQEETRNVMETARVVREELRGQRPGEHVILFFQELRDEAACTNLLAHIGSTNQLRLACVSKFEVAKGSPVLQQDGIFTDLPILDAGWSRWRWPSGQKKGEKPIMPPRGYVFALLDGGADGVIACYGVHLKSNYAATADDEIAANRVKRERAVEQLVELTKKIKLADGRHVTRMVIAGDFNTDVFSSAYAGERTIPLLTAAGYLNGLASAASDQRGTYPRFGKYADETLDYIFHRGFLAQTERWLSPQNEVSDHRMLWLRLE